MIGIVVETFDIVAVIDQRGVVGGEGFSEMSAPLLGIADRGVDGRHEGAVAFGRDVGQRSVKEGNGLGGAPHGEARQATEIIEREVFGVQTSAGGTDAIGFIDTIVEQSGAQHLPSGFAVGGIGFKEGTCRRGEGVFRQFGGMHEIRHHFGHRVGAAGQRNGLNAVAIEEIFVVLSRLDSARHALENGHFLPREDFG